MARAICEACGREVSWGARRGCRLEDRRCSCGGRLRSKTAGVPSKTRGKQYHVCAVCSRKRLHLRKTAIPLWSGHRDREIAIPVGSWVCHGDWVRTEAGEWNYAGGLPGALVPDERS